jgi:hypothetical protein
MPVPAGPAGTVTTADLIAETRRHILSGQRPQQNKLAAPVGTDATSLEFSFDPAGIVAGAYVQVDLEVFYVWSITGKTASVQPAQEGSPTSAHDQGDVVVVNPRVPDFAILQALNNCLRSLSSPALGLYQVKTVDLTYSSLAGGYDLPGVTGEIDIADIRVHRGDSTSKDWPAITTWNVSRDVNLTDFPSGLALFIQDGAEQGSDIRVRYRTGFGTLSSVADDVLTLTGLPETALDIPPMGAAIRLVHPREIKRNFTEAQGDGRRAGEVTPGAVSGSVNALERDYYRRISEEAGRLSQQNPPQGYIPLPSPYAVARPYARNGSWDFP